MLEAHVINRKNRHLYEAEWDAYLRIRHKVYVDEKKCRPSSADGREVDQFDNEDATYVLGFDDGRIVAGARLLPTSRPNLVSEIFPHMCEEKDVPRRDDWADWTRMFVVSDVRSGARRGPLTQICAAVMEYCLEEGIQYAGGIQELYFLPQWSLFRWKVVPMGLPHRVAGEWAIVAYLKVDEEALANVRRVLGVSGSLLVRRGPQVPFAGGDIGAGLRLGATTA